LEDDFITWKDSFWPTLCKKFGIAATGEDIWYVNIILFQINIAHQHLCRARCRLTPIRMSVCPSHGYRWICQKRLRK